MKRTNHLLGLVAALLLLQVNVFHALATNVDRQTAKQLAANFMAAKTLENSLTAADMSLVYEMQNPQLGQPALYFFNSKNGGFCVMSANDCMDPILAYSTEGVIDPDHMPANMLFFFQGYVNAIAHFQSTKATPSPEVAKMWKDLGAKQVRPDDAKVVYKTLTSVWDQDYPYNTWCPIVKEYEVGADGQYVRGEDGKFVPTGDSTHAPTGCVATAMAQIMHYWKYPVHPVGSATYMWQDVYYHFGPNGQVDYYEIVKQERQYVKFDTVYFNYDLMPDTAYRHANQWDYPGTMWWNDDQVRETSRFNYYAGITVEMGYSYEGSGTQSSKVPNALKNKFKYDVTVKGIDRTQSPFVNNSPTPNYRDTLWLDTIAQEIKAKRPVYYSGYDKTSAGVHAGHAFVAERYNTSTKMVWFNWGWGGSGDCYCNVVKSQLATSGYNFSSNHYAIIGIQPPEDTLKAMGFIGIEEVPQPVAINPVYPNPASQWVNIPYTLGDKMEAVLEIVALDGRVMERRTVSAAANKACVDVQGYAKGIYLARIDGVTRKFVVE